MATERPSLLLKIKARDRKCRPRRWAMKTIFITGFTTLVLWILFLRSRRAFVPNVVDYDFGVAFDLTSPYGPLYNYLPDFFRDKPRQAVRASRKAAGLPASSDVGELAKLIVSLRSAVEAHLDGRKISGAAATTPHLPAMYAEDLKNAFEYVGLIYVPHYPYWYGGKFPESGAVYTGNGFGLCSNYRDKASCDEEERTPSHQPASENVLSISYTTGMLTSTWSIGVMGFAYPRFDIYKLVDFNLGWYKRNENSNDEYYWEAIRDAIMEPALEASIHHWDNPRKILLHGDCSTDKRSKENSERSSRQGTRKHT